MPSRNRRRASRFGGCHRRWSPVDQQRQGHGACSRLVSPAEEIFGHADSRRRSVVSNGPLWLSLQMPQKDSDLGESQVPDRRHPDLSPRLHGRPEKKMEADEANGTHQDSKPYLKS
jgi:hypothetical protein